MPSLTDMAIRHTVIPAWLMTDIQRLAVTFAVALALRLDDNRNDAGDEVDGTRPRN
jgi:hypothetical protein